MVIAGAVAYFWLLTRVDVLAGHPAATAEELAWACSLALVGCEALVVVVTWDCEACVVLLFLESAKTSPTTRPAAATMRMPLRIRLRFCWRFASAARRASRA